VLAEDWQLADEAEDHAPEFKQALLLLMLKLNMHTNIIIPYVYYIYTVSLKKFKKVHPFYFCRRLPVNGRLVISHNTF